MKHVYRGMDKQGPSIKVNDFQRIAKTEKVTEQKLFSSESKKHRSNSKIVCASSKKQKIMLESPDKPISNPPQKFSEPQNPARSHSRQKSNTVTSPISQVQPPMKFSLDQKQWNSGPQSASSLTRALPRARSRYQHKPQMIVNTQS